MGLKLTVQQRSSTAWPFLVPLKQGIRPRKQRAAMFFPGGHFETDDQLAENGRFLMICHCKVKFPHREHRKVIAFAIAKNASQSDFIAKRSDCYARHHCTKAQTLKGYQLMILHFTELLETSILLGTGK